MTLKPLDGFMNLTTHHCVTGSMRHVYVYNGHDLSEDLLLGIGGGVGFIYWHMKGQDPFIGGRGGTRPPFMEELAGERTGVKLERHTTGSARKATESMQEILDAGQPLMIFCDMGFLPYFDFGGQEFHFGQHAVVICGLDRDSQQVLVADRDDILHPVPLEDMAKARSSTFKPFPPQNLWFTFDFTHKRLPTAGEVRQAVQEQALPMLEPPIKNIGVPGIRKAAKAIPGWRKTLNENELRRALFNAYIFISADGGTGGGLFRLMFGRFLHEAAVLASEDRFESSAEEFVRIGAGWDKLSKVFRQAAECSDPAGTLADFTAPLLELAGQEELAWRKLLQIVRD